MSGWQLAVYAVWMAQATAPVKRPRPLDPQDAVRMESGCRDYFPSKPKECPKELWKRCCEQEVSCHNYHCREVVMGKLGRGMHVRIKDDAISDDDSAATLTKGTKGRVVKVDSEGDALVRFFEDELDDEGVRHWVHRETFWEKLELPGNMERLRAWKTVSCLNDCSRRQECRLADMSKKANKAYQACVEACKMEECTKEDQCKELFHQYAQCKQTTSESKVCNSLKDEL
eukprot:TRINITY_DN53959_c0_g1_i1.p1 TRINITY_DN53959_c0_g1~~TRINITY_DN53959_c0_g1_i1.p1  ORF type:complete len:238 (+),score=57.36 TRINITY_DN53959_c0_g1_i1:28-714(+)